MNVMQFVTSQKCCKIFAGAHTEELHRWGGREYETLMYIIGSSKFSHAAHFT